MKWSDLKARSPGLASHALLRALTHLKGGITMSLQQTPQKVKGGYHTTTFATREELLEDLRRLNGLCERQGSEGINLRARLAVALEILKEHGLLERFLGEIGEGGMTS